MLKRCYHFTLKNINNYYYPLNDVKPNVKPKRSNTQKLDNTRWRFKRMDSNYSYNNNEEEEEEIKEEYMLKDNVHNCKVIENFNKDVQVIYNGSEFNDISDILDLNNAIPFLFFVKKKMNKFQPKNILLNIVKFFEIKIKAPKQLSVCNFNN